MYWFLSTSKHISALLEISTEAKSQFSRICSPGAETFASWNHHGCITWYLSEDRVMNPTKYTQSGYQSELMLNFFKRSIRINKVKLR